MYILFLVNINPSNKYATAEDFSKLEERKHSIGI